MWHGKMVMGGKPAEKVLGAVLGGLRKKQSGRGWDWKGVGKG